MEIAKYCGQCFFKWVLRGDDRTITEEEHWTSLEPTNIAAQKFTIIKGDLKFAKEHFVHL